MLGAADVVVPNEQRPGKYLLGRDAVLQPHVPESIGFGAQASAALCIWMLKRLFRAHVGLSVYLQGGRVSGAAGIWVFRL